jgi:hypothetical protein
MQTDFTPGIEVQRPKQFPKANVPNIPVGNRPAALFSPGRGNQVLTIGVMQ